MEWLGIFVGTRHILSVFVYNRYRLEYTHLSLICNHMNDREHLVVEEHIWS